MHDAHFVLKVLSETFKGTSFRKTALMFKITHQTISKWVKQYGAQLHEVLAKREINQIKKKKTFDIEHINHISKLVNKNPFITRQEVIDSILATFDVKLTRNNITTIYKSLSFTRKKPKYLIVKNTKYLETLTQTRKTFVDEINKCAMNKIISIDECGFNKIFGNQRGLSPKGEHIYVPEKQLKTKNISTLMALTTCGVLHSHINEESTNSDIFIAFIKEIIEKLKKKRVKCGYTFLMDNVAFHKSKELKKIIKDSNNFLMYTPPYSPNNNPVEHLFSVIKHNYYKKNIEDGINVKTTPHGIIGNITQAINKAKNDNYKKYFTRALNYNYVAEETQLRDRLIVKNN
jgi:transposase